MRTRGTVSAGEYGLLGQGPVGIRAAYVFRGGRQRIDGRPGWQGTGRCHPTEEAFKQTCRDLGPEIDG